MLFNKENKVDFACQSCGNCCKFFNINITHLDIKRILENRQDLKTEDFISFSAAEKGDSESFISTYGKRQLTLKKKKEKDECVFLVDNVCSIHEFKPKVCKVWPFSLEKNDRIDWIQEHKSFIKNKCAHISIKGANDPEELRVLIKQHYKERKIFEKLVQKWNEEKKEFLKGDDTFFEVYDQDFLNFLADELGVPLDNYFPVTEENYQLNDISLDNNLTGEKVIDVDEIGLPLTAIDNARELISIPLEKLEDEYNEIKRSLTYSNDNSPTNLSESLIGQNNNFLREIIVILSQDKRIELISQSQVNTLNNFHSNSQLDVYIKRINIESFNDENTFIELANKFKSQLHNIDDLKISFLINKEFLDINIKPFSELKKAVNYDTEILYNPNLYNLILKDLITQTKEEIIEIYNVFWFKFLRIIQVLNSNSLIQVRVLHESLITCELFNLIFWLNQKKLTIDNLESLEYKPKNLNSFIDKFIYKSLRNVNTESDIQDTGMNFNSESEPLDTIKTNKKLHSLKADLMELISIFKETWQITGLNNNDDLEFFIEKEINTFFNSEN